MILVQRYIFRQLLGPALTAAAAFAGLALLTQSLSNFDLISNYSETGFTFFKVTVLALPQLVALLSPFALFVAALIGLNRLTMESELTIASAAGMSRSALLTPLMRLAVLALLANLAVNLFVQPLAYREMRLSLFELRTDLAASLVRPGQFTNLGSGVTIYARTTEPGGRMRDVFINDARDQDASTYVAREGVVVRSTVRPSMVLIDGSVQQIDQHGALNLLAFERYEFDLSEFIDSTELLFFKDSDKFLFELFNPDPGDRVRARDEERLLAEAHYRLSAPLYNITLVLIAAAAFFAGEHSRLGYGGRVLLAVAAALTVRLTGFAVQSAATDNPNLNAVQYLIPVLAALVALALIYAPARRRPGSPAPAEG